MNLLLKFLFYFFICLSCSALYAQHDIHIKAQIDTKEHLIKIDQEIHFKNQSNVALDTIYLLDWANSFSNKTTPLAKRFAENFQSNFHFEKKENRGSTLIYSATDLTLKPLYYERGKELDILKVALNKPLLPGEVFSFKLLYEVKIPDAKFTRYGHLKNGNYNLRYWYITPGVFDGEWQVYSNKNLDDHYMEPSDINISFTGPENFVLVSDLEVVNEVLASGLKTTYLQGKNRTNTKLYLQHLVSFESIITDDLEVLTSIDDKGLYPPLKAIQIDRILQFLKKELGDYPFEKMVVSDEDYKEDPAYGLNQLPSFIRPFPDGFQYDMEQLKTITSTYLENTILVNPRKEHWLSSALQIYLMMKYTDMYYPDMKVFGTLSNIIGLRWFHASDLDFNDQYYLLYLNIARLNLDQALATPKDSLIKYNKNIASPYKGGVGLNYLNSYLGGEALAQSIKQYYETYKASPSEVKDFEEILRSKTDKNLDWFFNEYVATNKKIDYKVKGLQKTGDSLHVIIENKRSNNMPFSISGLTNNNEIYKIWVPGFDSTRTIVLPSPVDRVAIDNEQEIPEYNKRNNYYKTSGLLRKPLQFRLLVDVEDPEYHQAFFMPVFEYNLYDGLTIGAKIYNKTVIPKDFLYKIEPQYGLTSNAVVGGGSFSYMHNRENSNLYGLRFGASGRTFSYNTDLFYKKLSAYTTLAFREDNLRSNRRQFINLRSVLVHRDQDPMATVVENPNYNVINLQYAFSNANLINYFRSSVDYEVSGKFQKLFTTVEYRKLFLNNRQLNLRFFAGVFLRNKEEVGSDFFSFALDRPTDYMFDYNYYGRSEDTGLFSQQLIMAEGGFKSRLEPAFADNWMATVNASTNIWKWIYIYGDLGLVNNRNIGTQALFDSGIRVNLVTDYFELYFPLYSNLGWEPGMDNYDQKIRFIVTLSPQTLLRLFTRRWY